MGFSASLPQSNRKKMTKKRKGRQRTAAGEICPVLKNLTVFQISQQWPILGIRDRQPNTQQPDYAYGEQYPCLL
jgi:hypothetical protein